MKRIWRTSPGLLLTLYLVLEVITLAYAGTIGETFNSGRGIKLWFDTVGAAQNNGGIVGLALVGFVWRVWRGGWISRIILLLFSGLAVVMTGLALIMTGSLYFLGLLAFCCAEFTLLCSPALRSKVV